MMTVIIAIACLLLCWVCSASAKTPRLVFTKQSPIQPCTSYTIKKGDHLYAIIRDQGFPEKDIPKILDAIRRLNPTLDPLAPIHPGQTIRLPIGPKPPREKNLNPPKNQNRDGSIQKGAGSPGSPTSYTLKRGDTLLGVMRQKTQMDLQEIMGSYMQGFLALNPKITNMNLVYPGQSVILPCPSHPEQPSLHHPRPSTQDIFPSLLPSSELTDLSPEQAKAFVGECLKIMGFVFAPGKETFFPLPDSEWVRIDTTTTPLIETPWGARLLLVPAPTKKNLLGDLSKIGLTTCIVPTTWNPFAIMQSLAKKFPDKLAVFPDTVAVNKKIGRIHTVVHVDISVHALWSRPDTIFCFQAMDKNQQPFPALLSSLLLQGNIRLVQWQRTTNKHLVRIDHPQIKKKDIYIPTLSEDDLDTLITVRWGQTFTVPGLPSAPKTIPRPTQITLHWTAGQARIHLATDVLQLDTEDRALILLDQEMKDPYLVALLELKGISCHALVPAQSRTD
jgi:LysM repeat protein